MVKSTVIDRKTGQSIDSRVRTSSGMFLRRGGDKIIRNIEKRIADFTFIPVEHGESLQVLHYEVGQKYEPHFDYVLDEFHSKNWPQRIATVLMYLSDVEEGGETIFPAAKGNFSSNPGWNELSECAKRGLSVKPKMGDALLFWNMRPDATLDPSSLHGGCPVIKGNKWSSTKWMHVGEFGTNFLSRGEGDGLGKRGEQWTEILSWEPRAFLFHNFLSKEECEYLINQAKPHMMKSTVVDSKTGQSKDSRVRTSSGMFLRRGRDKIIRNIEKRIADFTFIPVEHGEGLQVLHYEVGQKYEPHFDYFLDEFNTKNGGQRIATVLMYLSDVEEGGETIFPAAKGNFSSNPGWNELSECAKRGLSVKPKMGNALLFWSMRPDATLDPSSLHGGCPVIKGNKWSSTKWMHVGEYKN